MSEIWMSKVPRCSEDKQYQGRKIGQHMGYCHMG
jgi:hypothetical protein